MFLKKANVPFTMDIEAVHIPSGGAWDFYNTSIIKTASIDKTKSIDLGGFDISAAIEKNPDNLFVKVFAIKANEVNDNGDCFNESELKKAAHTFVGVPVFVNHQNDNVENARGKVVHSWYDDSKKGIYCINMVDRAAYPRLARGIEEKYISGTSMGAQVGYSLCSICHNKAHTADEFCAHIKSGKNRKISGKYDCKYHESSCKPEDPCPLDGCKKSSKHELLHKEAKVFEWNYDIKFIEDSFVVNPACHDCLVCDILNVDKIKSKVAENISQLKKVATSLASTVDEINDTCLEKTAGKTELQALSQAMNLMEHVARSMMAQKQQIQLDYASDLVENMAKVQSLLDELTEMGYGQLPSPTDQENAIGSMLGSAPTPQSSVAQQVMDPSQVGGGAARSSPQQSAAAPQQSSVAPRSAPAGVATEGLGEIGSVTRPTFTGASTKIKKDFLKNAEYINEKLGNLSADLRKSILILAQRSFEVDNNNGVAEHTKGDTRITVAHVDGSGFIVGKWKNDKLVSWSAVEEFGENITKMASQNPQEAARLIMDNFYKESGDNMSDNKTTKVAASSQTEVTTQKQLDDAGPLHARKGVEVSVTTEAQLEGKGEIKTVNDTTSDSPQLRTGKAPEVVTQAQLQELQGDLARWDSFPEVITEAQWDEMSRRVSSCCGDKYTEQTTQAQLEGLQKMHKWTAPEVTTEAQLTSQKKAYPETDSERLASSARNLMKAATSTVADAIANYNLSPADIKAAVALINATPYAQIKAAYLSLVNGAPNKIEARTASRNRKSYFAKVADVQNINPIDGLLAAMGDNIGYNKAEDFVSALTFAANNEKVFASAEQNAHIKIAESKSTASQNFNKENVFMNAFNEMNRSEDGLYKICGTLTEDVTVDPSDKASFMQALHTYASSHISSPFIIANVDLDTEAGVFEMDCKESAVCSMSERKAFASYMDGLVKTASTDTEDDGLVKISGTLAEDVTVDPADKNKFMRAMYSFAKQHMDSPFVIANIDISDNQETFDVVCKKAEYCSAVEKQTFAKIMNSTIKTASTNASDDGLYKIYGTLTEDVTVDPTNKAEFMKAMYTFARSHINKPFVIANVDINTENSTFEVDCKDKAFCNDVEKRAFASAITNNFKTAQAYDTDFESSDEGEAGDMLEDSSMEEDMGEPTMASSRNKMIRQAQMMGGELGGGMGGGGPAGGMGATMPGAAAGGMPGAEALSGAPGAAPGAAPGGEAGGLGGDAGGEEDSDMKAKPPGTMCVICGSNDVDVIDGKCKCNNCTGEFVVSVGIDITKYPSVLDTGGKGEGEDKEQGGESGEGFAMPENKEPASLPVAASARLTDSMIKVAKAEFAALGKEWSLGAVSPFTGNAATMRVEGNKFMCLDTGRTFQVSVAKVAKNNNKAIFAQWQYDAIPLERECDVCKRQKSAFNKALAAQGIDEDTFDGMLLTEKGKTILAMKEKGLLKAIKTASRNDVVEAMQRTTQYGSKFPIQTCREKIARKFGENALALSGPCEGSNLADCVCSKMARASVYANDVAIKVASIWANEDQMVNCVEDFVRTKQFNMKEACFVCDQLKTKYAQTEDMVADKLDDSDPSAPTPPTPAPTPTDSMPPALPEGDAEKEMGDTEPATDSITDEMNPFDGDAAAGGGTVTIELPVDVVKKIDEAMDTALGEDASMEEHHDEMPSTDATDEIPTETGDMGGEADIAPAGDMGGEAEEAANAFDAAAKETTGNEGGMPPAAGMDTEVKMSADEDENEEHGEREDGESDDENKNHEDHADTEKEEEGEGKKELPDFLNKKKDNKDHDSTEKHDSKEEHEVKDHSEDSEKHEDKSEENEENNEENKEDGDDSSKPPHLDKTGDEDKEGDGHEKESKEASALNVFRKGRISGTGEISLNLDNVLKVLANKNNQIKQAKEVTLKNVQDSVGKIQDGKTMGHEEKFKMNKPEVPSAGKKSLMGGESEAGLDIVTNKPEFDAGGGEMGNEKSLGYTSEKTHEVTGGENGKGNHKASSKARTTVLAERIMKNIKTASDKKLDNAKPVSEHSEIGKYSADKDLSDSSVPRKPFESADIGKTDDNQLMGHEKDTVKDIPKAGKDAPSIPAGGGRNSKYDKNEKYAPEKQTAIKGTVIAGGNAESLAAKKEAATRVAGRKLKAGMITIDNLASEIDKLSRYEVSDIGDIESALFGASKKGFDTVAKGSEKPLVISEVSNQRKGGQELQSALQNLFSLHKKNELAKDDPNFDLRRNF